MPVCGCCLNSVGQTDTCSPEIREVTGCFPQQIGSTHNRCGTNTPMREPLMATVDYVNATCIYPGATAPSVNSLNLDIQNGEFMVLVGPSGSGKSTALRMLAGLEEVSSGEIRIDNVDVSNKPPKDRDIAMVFQNYALYPHMTVARNMGFALKRAKVPAAEIERKVNEAAELLGITDQLERKPPICQVASASGWRWGARSCASPKRS